MPEARISGSKELQAGISRQTVRAKTVVARTQTVERFSR